MKHRAIIGVLLLALLAAALTIIRQQSGSGSPIEKRMKKFISCLPDTLRDEQKLEVKRSLEHFQYAAESGVVAKNDYNEVVGILDRYIEQGSITKQELHVVLAKVGYYSIRMSPQNQDAEGNMKPPDHPLLETGGAADTSSYQP